MRVDKKALQCLMDYHWPGNVRELQHVIEKGVILSDSKVLSKSDLCSQRAESEVHDLSFASYNLEEVERKIIRKVLKVNTGNLTHSAEVLGITRTSLYRRLKKYDL